MKITLWLGAVLAAGLGTIAACSSDSGTETPPDTDASIDAGADVERCPGATSCGDKCVDTNLDPANCGGCGVACAAGQVCSAGKCGITCSAGTTLCGTRCVDTLSDRANCGGCGGSDAGSFVCAAGEVCSAGKCAVSCGAGLVECGGTCVDPKTSRAYCGATAGCGGDGGSAGSVCRSGELCADGTCAPSCLVGQILCGGKCVDPATDRAYCGATDGCGVGDAGSAGSACASGEVCSGGKCGTSCPAGQVNCGGKCVDPLTDRAYCGATDGCGVGDAGSAGTACASGQVCTAGSCATSCVAGQVLCGGKCVDPQTDRAFCGATAGCGVGGTGSAGATCASGEVCTAGACAASCVAGQVLCAGKCVDPATDRAFCGATAGCGVGGAGSAGASCASGEVCTGGACAASCIAGQVLCAGKCVDPLTDRAYCGATSGCGVGGVGSAGTDCASGNVCSGGTCAPSCLPGQVLCAGKCVDPATDRSHCGATAGCGVGGAGSAGAVCSAGQICSGGACDVSCASPLVKCTPTSGGPYCTSTASDPANCGACGTICPVRANAKTVCAAGTCAYACNTGFVDCNGLAADGCEANLANDKNNCGKCGNVCALSCSGGACLVTPTCAMLLTTAPIWGSPGRGLALSSYTNGTLDWLGCMGNGCTAASFFCTDESTGIYFGTTEVSALRTLVDPGNAGGDTYPTTHSGCSTAGSPRSISNAPNASNNGVGGFNSADALCKAMGFASGVVVATQPGNVCPRPHTTTANGSNWTSTWNGSDGIWGQSFRCSR